MESRRLLWIYVLQEDFSWQSGMTFATDREFMDCNGKTRLIILKDGTMTVLKGYAWDGCSPKFQVWDLIVGVPDGVPSVQNRLPKAYYASLIHDALCQFFHDGLDMSWSQVDGCFLKILNECNFSPKWIYYLAIRVYGRWFRSITRKTRNLHGSVREIDSSKT